MLIVGYMLMDAVRWLRESGVTVEDLSPASSVDVGVDSILDVTVGDRSARFSVQVKSRAPYPHEVERLRRSWHGLEQYGHPLIIAPFISEALGSLLTGDDWSWADAQGNFDLRAPGLISANGAPLPLQRQSEGPCRAALAAMRSYARSWPSAVAKTKNSERPRWRRRSEFHNHEPHRYSIDCMT